MRDVTPEDHSNHLNLTSGNVKPEDLQKHSDELFYRKLEELFIKLFRWIILRYQSEITRTGVSLTELVLSVNQPEASVEYLSAYRLLFAPFVDGLLYMDQEEVPVPESLVDTLNRYADLPTKEEDTDVQPKTGSDGKDQQTPEELG